MMKLKQALAIADIHVERLTRAHEKLLHVFPLTEDKYKNLTEEELLYVELLINRFAKLQDLMGRQIITLLLGLSGEPVEEMTYIDKINRLEKLKIFLSANEWNEMRKTCNYVAHEYPEHPELIVDNLNKTFNLINILKTYLQQIKAFIQEHSLIK